MDTLSNLFSETVRFLPLLATLAGVSVLLTALNRYFRRRWKDNPDLQFRFQLTMLALTLAGGLAVVIALPVNDVLRGQLLSLIGILLSAAIALSSTTFIGNILAGIMLKVVRSARPGDFISIGELTGRVTEMDLLHTQVQTEFRDLVTVPNLFMVTQPLQVVRASGTIIHAEVSLGYDVHHDRAMDVLLAAAAQAGLKDAFVHVRELGDFSISYRVAGLLEDVQSLISARSALRNGGVERAARRRHRNRFAQFHEHKSPRGGSALHAPTIAWSRVRSQARDPGRRSGVRCGRAGCFDRGAAQGPRVG